ncbi:MAG: 4Fe-4S dicluster domain-containing protein [Deltaproteobacteria bacterium]|jgi:Fe-S-cluster-containing dehydrogenase component|nr:4Fe-4S dicluster domain-containing protein [Deltaproteobacteria bacterium]
MNRRNFLISLASAGIAAGTSASPARAAVFSGHPDALGVLHDSARCIGCRRCEAGCQRVNADVLPTPDKYKVPEGSFYLRKAMDRKRRPDFQRFTVVNRYVFENRLPVYRKFQCYHCLEPACASTCFVRALRKTKEGPVSYRPDLCVGCRYCMVACPFYAPAYHYDNVWNPLIYKCTFCAPRLAKGLLPGCVEICPKEALTFGKRQDLLKIARERIAANPGVYVEHIYGEYEMGGTSWLYLSPVPHALLGQPELGRVSAPELTSGALGAVAMVAGIWPVLLGGAYAISKRREQLAEEDKRAAVARALAEIRNPAADPALKDSAAARPAAEEKQ